MATALGITRAVRKRLPRRRQGEVACPQRIFIGRQLDGISDAVAALQFGYRHARLIRLQGTHARHRQFVIMHTPYHPYLDRLLVQCPSIIIIFTAETLSTQRNSLTNTKMTLRSLRLCGEFITLQMDTRVPPWDRNRAP